MSLSGLLKLCKQLKTPCLPAVNLKDKGLSFLHICMCYKHTRTHTRLLKLEFSEAAVTSQLISFVFFLCLRFFFFFRFITHRWYVLSVRPLSPSLIIAVISLLSRFSPNTGWDVHLTQKKVVIQRNSNNNRKEKKRVELSFCFPSL